MLIGVPKEIKVHEYRVGLTPGSVRELIQAGHQVIIEQGAGAHIGFSDDLYASVGARIVSAASEVFAQADMIVKVKEPQIAEYALLRAGQILFTYLHLAPDRQQTQALIDSQCIAIAYETVTNHLGQLPLLTPMSEVAGRMSIQVAAHCLEKYAGGSGILLGGVAGVQAGHVVIIGGGVVGTAAARMAMGLEARVTVLDRSPQRLQDLNFRFGNRLHTVYSTTENLEHYIAQADVVIGAVLVPGAAAPRLVKRSMLATMQPGSVMVDVAIDQGGCFETSRPTTHADPTYTVDGIVHYCVTNMPGAVARTSTVALNNATLPYVLKLANQGYKNALISDQHFMNGLNICQGHVTHHAVAQDLGYPFIDPVQLLNNQVNQ